MAARSGTRQLTSTWGMRDRGTLWFCALWLGVFAAYSLISLMNYFHQPDALFPDFFGLWSFVRFAMSRPAEQIYDPDVLFAFQRQLDASFSGGYPYPYPPSFLLILWPLGLMPYGVARPVWILVTLALYLVAIGLRPCRPMVAAALLAPTTTIAVVYGQSGFLTAALMIGGFRLARSRPVVAGMLLGLLACKPQLAIIVPVALLAAGLWRTIAASCVTFVLMVAASSIAFGWSIWLTWIAAIPRHWSLFEAARARLDPYMPTVTANLHMLGIGPMPARVVQSAVAVAVAAIVWACLRRGVSLLSASAVPVGTFLATPYAFIYDMPMVTGAVLAVIEDAMEKDASFSFGEVLVLVLAMVIPILMFSPMLAAVPLSWIGLAPLLWLIARRIVPGDRDRGGGHRVPGSMSI